MDGPYGGGGGSPNSDEAAFQGKNITQIVVTWNDFVAFDSIKVRYGADSWGHQYGPTGSSNVNEDVIDLQADEHITSVSGIMIVLIQNWVPRVS